MKYRISSQVLTVPLLCALVVWLAGCEARTTPREDSAPPPPSSSPESSLAPAYDVPTVAFCELVRNPKQYAGNVVRIRAIVVAGKEIYTIYDQSCYGEDTLTWIEHGSKESSIALYDGLQAHRGDNRAMRVNATLVGHLEGPSEEGYGHLNGFKYQFIVMSVESVKAVPPEVPWP